MSNQIDVQKIVDFAVGYAYHRGYSDALQDDPAYMDHDELVKEILSDKDFQKLAEQEPEQ